MLSLDTKTYLKFPLWNAVSIMLTLRKRIFSTEQKSISRRTSLFMELHSRKAQHSTSFQNQESPPTLDGRLRDSLFCRTAACAWGGNWGGRFATPVPAGSRKGRRTSRLVRDRRPPARASPLAPCDYQMEQPTMSLGINTGLKINYPNWRTVFSIFSFFEASYGKTLRVWRKASLRNRSGEQGKTKENSETRDNTDAYRRGVRLCWMPAEPARGRMRRMRRKENSERTLSEEMPSSMRSKEWSE